jgi:hypothetical protein
LSHLLAHILTRGGAVAVVAVFPADHFIANDWAFIAQTIQAARQNVLDSEELFICYGGLLLSKWAVSAPLRVGLMGQGARNLDNPG